MRIFISAGEPSGDIHGASLIHALRERRPDLEFVGFGGERMQAAGAQLLYPLVNHAVMWIASVFAQILTFLSLLSRADRYFAHDRPDAVIVIDYPGFHWWIARRAHARGISVYYFVPPQLWAWGGWRVEKVRRFVDHVLCTLPFEKTWYAERGVDAVYVGHPFFDELPSQKLDAAFLAQQRSRPGDIVALLPGSRTQEVKRNLTTLIRTAETLHRGRSGCRFLVASFKASQQAMVDAELAKHPGLPIETHVGCTPEILELAKACVAVSGSVSLELLYRRLPSVIVYRMCQWELAIGRFFMKTKWMCLVNLLAEKELYPEYLTHLVPAKEIAAHLRRWLDDPAALEKTRSELTTLRRRYAEPGACGRAAEHVLRTLDGSDVAHNKAA
jgi:lipid-A-disaccharide synthase